MPPPPAEAGWDVIKDATAGSWRSNAQTARRTRVLSPSTSPAAAGEEREDGGLWWACLEGTAGSTEAGTEASDQRTPCACTGGSRQPKTDQNGAERLRLGRSRLLPSGMVRGRCEAAGGGPIYNFNSVIKQPRASVMPLAPPLSSAPLT